MIEHERNAQAAERVYGAAAELLGCREDELDRFADRVRIAGKC